MLSKLLNVQKELKAPKGQFNKFGNYKYRSCEDILESVKPILAKYNCTIVINDEIVNVGDRFYIRATATFYDVESKDSIKVSALARESIDKKGMDDSQITGSTSSYARKYALNGLLLIDDTKDADANEYHEQVEKKQEPKKEAQKPTVDTSTPLGKIMNIWNTNEESHQSIRAFLQGKSAAKLKDLNAEQQKELLDLLEAMYE